MTVNDGKSRMIDSANLEFGVWRGCPLDFKHREALTDGSIKLIRTFKDETGFY